MKCPACQVDLKVTAENGRDVAYCPQCDVNWIDQDDFEIDVHRPDAVDPDWNPDSLEMGRSRRAVNRNGSV
jgi:Zn-finger nucleic acid-binding protein